MGQPMAKKKKKCKTAWAGKWDSLHEEREGPLEWPHLSRRNRWRGIHFVPAKAVVKTIESNIETSGIRNCNIR